MSRVKGAKQSNDDVEGTVIHSTASADGDSVIKAVNPATVPQRSPFRYPGGKTWLVPSIRQWLRQQRGTTVELVEPFAGGAIVGLTAAFEKLVSAVTLVELDEDVAAVWRTVLYGDAMGLAERYINFEPNQDNIRTLADQKDPSLADRAFATLVRNRVSRGGIIAPGAGILKRGQNDQGLSSRWYPETIQKRILDLAHIKDRIRFIRADGISVMEAYSGRSDVVWFIDPPYTVAGKRLYTLSEVDHEYLFHVTSRLAGDFVMTYDDTAEIRGLAERSGFQMRQVRMRTTHHNDKFELIIGRNLDWT